jgi:glucan phosphoethanolaminetransferase (alkaline phosphatase superfamily)
MDNIDKSLNTLMQQIDSIDATPHHTSSSLPTSNFFSSIGGGKSNFAKQYFFYWSLFLFLLISILIIRPSCIYRKHPTTEKITFVWSNFFVVLLTMYFSILLLYWIHTRLIL